MDQERFDQLTVQLAHGATRRTILYGLSGTSLAAFLGIIGLGRGPEVVAARGRGVHDRRQAHRHKHSARQDHLRARGNDCGKKGGPCCAPDDGCHGNLNCVAGVCVKPNRGGGNCANGETRCRGTCVDTTTDPANCGACGDSCPVGASCCGGDCLASCAAPLVRDATCQCVCPPGVLCCVDGACPAGQDCISGICLCRGADCTTAGNIVCGFGRTCQAGGNGLSCCCSPNENTQVPCAPGQNAVCCSGFCGDDGVCTASPA